LQTRGGEYGKDAQQKLKTRGLQEAKAMRTILETQRKHIADTEAKHARAEAQGLLPFFEDPDEQRQLEANRRHWTKRLLMIDRELESEPQRIADLYHETLRPTFVVPEFQPKNPDRPWLMLVQSLPIGTDFDTVHVQAERNWQATPQGRIERLLRETEVPIGLLFNHTHLRLVYAPRGETSGHATFGVNDMATVAGRPIFAALHMLLSAERLFSMPEKQRLPAILADSRKYQNVVSTQLAQQVLAALYELLRGFQAADDAMKGQLLREVLANDPNHVYAGLLTVLMRLVFILYAEDRGLLSTDSVYVNYYSVTGLFDRLRAEPVVSPTR
jgi:hypothetical protein